MKKFTILLFSLFSFASFSNGVSEIQLKTGIDFYRPAVKVNTKDIMHEYTTGFNFNAELIPLSFYNRVELGIGASISTDFFKPYMILDIFDRNDIVAKNLYVPMYGLIKFNLFNTKDGTPLAIATRLGYTYMTQKQDFIDTVIEKTTPGGLYFGVAIGGDYKNFTMEILYDGTLYKIKRISRKLKGEDFDYTKFPNSYMIQHKIGVQIGVKFGSPYNIPSLSLEQPKVTNAKPKVEKIEKKVVPVVKEVIVPTPVVVEKPVVVEVPKVIKGIEIYDVDTQKNTNLKLNRYNSKKLPNILYQKKNGYLYSPNTKEVYGSNGTTNARYVYIKDNDEIKLDGNKPLILKVIKNNGNLNILSDKNGYRVINKIDEKEEEVALFPSYCSDDSCIINGFAVASKSPSRAELKQIKLFVNTLNEYAKSADLYIYGHTDSQGRASYNERLGLSRATTIARLLRENGLNKGFKIKLVSTQGENEPIATNSTAYGRYQNRRVEIKFKNQVK